jgi:alpha-1,6-mannosyltransferase
MLAAAGPGTVTAGTAAPSSRLPVVTLPALLGLVGSGLVLLTGGRAAIVTGVTPPSRWLGLLDVPRGDLVGWVPVGLIVGVALLVGGWLRLLQLIRGGRLGTGSVGLTIGLWALPMLVGPPLLSLDAYSYLAQGEMQRFGLDPYSVGPAALGPGPGLSAVDPFWQRARAPYGPLAVLLARACAAAGGPVAQLVALHVLAALGLLVVGVSLCAACPPPRRPMVLALGVANPLVLLQLLSAAHWEALMVAALVGGLALWRRGNPLAAVVLAAAAAAVKSPALLAVPVLALAYLRAQPGAGRRWRAAGAVTAAAMAPWVLLALVVPNPLGFLGTMATPLAGRTLYAPTTLASTSMHCSA